jgi:hypothetical protein
MMKTPAFKFVTVIPLATTLLATEKLSAAEAPPAGENSAVTAMPTDLPPALPSMESAIAPVPIVKLNIAPQPNTPPSKSEHFDWPAAAKETLCLLAFQHTFRLTERKTRSELGGRFFGDWYDSARNFRGWSDGDSTFTQYFGHPIQGAWAGYIQIQNDPVGKKLEFSNSSAYWQSRLKAMGFAALYEIQWHLGPISEASFGHVGKKDGTLAASEFITSPTGGFGIMVGEDWLDRYVIERWEEGTHSLAKRRLYRVVLKPQRAFVNCFRLKKPWYRDTRSLAFGLPGQE